MKFSIRVALSLIAVTAPSFAWGASVFSDGTFELSEWSITRIPFGNGGDQFEVQQFIGGHPDEYLEITNAVAPAPVGDFSRILGAYLKNSAVHDPQTGGAIQHVNYSEDALLVNGFGNGQGIRPALQQGGEIFLGPLMTSPDFAWAPKIRNGLVAADFYLAPEVLSVHPDFSASGEPITFGFARLNTTLGNGITIVGGIDNWRVEVVSVPEPATAALICIIGGLFFCASRQRCAP